MKNVMLTGLLLLCFSLFVQAQPDGPDAPAPFGFVELLIGAGALYGGKKVYESKKAKK